MQHDLLQTGRLPRSVVWCDFTPGKESIPSLLGQLAAEVQGHIVLIDGDRIYHPSLHRRAAEWDGQDGALTLVTDCELVGICAISQETAVDLSRRCPAVASSIDDLHAWLTLTHSVGAEPVAQDKWQRILNEQQRQSAEHKLNTWLVKPTDGILPEPTVEFQFPSAASSSPT